MRQSLFGGYVRVRRMQGQAIVAALVMILFLTTIMGSITVALITEARFLDQQHQRTVSFYIARAGVEAAMNQLLKPSPGYDAFDAPWSDGAKDLGEIKLAQPGTIEGIANVTYNDEVSGAERPGVVDEERKLNINKADPAMLSRLDPAFTEQIVKAIVDRRSKRPFISINEIIEVPEVRANFLTAARDAAPAGLQSLLTVWGDGKININTAPAPVLKAAGLSEEAVKNLVAFRTKEGAAPAERVFKDVGAAKSVIGGSEALDNFTTSSKYFTITSKGQTDKPELASRIRQVVARSPEALQVVWFEQLR